MFTFVDFWFPSILMGVGIAIDVAIATVVMFRDEKLSFRSWTLPIMSTHIAFPAVGYYLFWGLGATFTPLQVALGFVGAALVAAFLYEATSEWRGREPAFAISDWMSEKFKGRGLAWLTPAILAVSWDALWSGPAKAAQALHWTTSEVLVSFIVAGLVVAAVAELALAAALQLRRINFRNAERLARFNIVGKFGEVSVIGGFGTLSLWHGLSPFLGATMEPNLYASIVLTSIGTFSLFLLWRSELWETELDDCRTQVLLQDEVS